jgi:hypothetical protein
MRTIAVVVIALVWGCGKPNIESSCTMNGFGAGSCSFTNTGDSEGALCGTIVVVNKNTGQTASSSKFCSGKVAESSTAKVEFSIPDVRSVCETEGDWTQVCAFEFLDDAALGKMLAQQSADQAATSATTGTAGAEPARPEQKGFLFEPLPTQPASAP